MFSYFARYSFLLLLMIVTLIPGGLALYSYFFATQLPDALKPDYQLSGMVFTPKTSLVLDLDHIQSHQTQKALEEWVDNNIPLRSLLIRLNNQFYYSLFKKSYVADGKVIIGKGNQLISSTYIDIYCNSSNSLNAVEEETLTKWADRIKWLADYYRSKGKLFFYILTPMKVEYMPQIIPTRFHCKTTGISPYAQRLVQLLDARQVPYIDGPQLMIEATQKYNIPMFNRGGIHWNELAAMTAVEKAVAIINKQAKGRFQPLTFNYHQVPEAVGESRDLLDLINLAFPNAHYAVPIVDIPAKQLKTIPTAAFIGGSFCENLISMMRRAGIVKNTKFFSYFSDVEYDFDEDGFVTVVPMTIPHALKTIEEAELIILERNSVIRVSSLCDENSNCSHGPLFYKSLFNKTLKA